MGRAWSFVAKGAEGARGKRRSGNDLGELACAWRSGVTALILLAAPLMPWLLTSGGAELWARVAGRPTGVPALFLALEEQQVEGVRRALDAGTPVDAVDHLGQTPLLYAATFRGAAVVEELLRRGADPSYTAPNGLTPLRRAAACGNVAAIHLLIDAGADPNPSAAAAAAAEEEEGEGAPLFDALVYGSEPAARALIERGADPRRIGFTRLRRLADSFDARDAGLVQLLAEAGIDLRAVPATWSR